MPSLPPPLPRPWPSARQPPSPECGESPAGALAADAQRTYANTQLAFVNTGSIAALRFGHTGTQGSGTITGVWLGRAGDHLGVVAPQPARASTSRDGSA